ncbi:MAG: PAS domain S-box protein [Bacteroidota bacterium]|jgi:PAS domain S-box-containing protein
MSFNRLLERQIKRSLSPEICNDPTIVKFLQQVNESYDSFERDKALLENAFKITEAEYTCLNQELNESHKNLNVEIVKTLNRAEKLISSFADITEYDLLFENIKQQIEAISQNDNILLYLFDDDENKLKLVYSKGYSEEEKKFAEENLMDFVPGYVFKTGQIAWLNNDTINPTVHNFNSKIDADSLSSIFVPIKFKEKTIGSFGIQCNVPNAYDKRQLASMKVFAGLTSNAYISIKKNSQFKQKYIENEKLSILAKSTANYVIYCDKDAKITWVNKSFEEGTGYLLSEIVGKKPGSFLCGPETESEKTDQLRNAINERKSCSVTITNYTKSGQPYKVNIQLNPVFDDNGEFINFVSIQQDVTELEIKNKKIAENQIQLQANFESIAESQKRYSNLLQTTHDLITILDTNGIILYANNSWLNKMNYTLEEVLGNNIFGHIHPDSQQHCMSFFGEIKSGQNKSLEVNYSLISKLGHKVDVDGNVICKYENGKLIELNSFLIDVTEINRINIEKLNRSLELKQSKDKLERVMGSLNETVWGVSLPENKLDYISESALSLYEIPLENWYNNPNLWSDVIHPADKERIEKESEAIFTLGHTNLEYRIVTPNNKVKWIYSNKRVLKNEDGIPYLMTGISGDITARKLAEMELINFKTAIDESAIVSIADVNGIITYTNDKFCKISKYTRQELIGANHNILNSNHHSKEFFEDMWQTISSGAIWKGEIKNKSKDGSEYYLESTIVPFMDNGKPFQYIAISYESTNLRLKEEAILKQKLFYETILNYIPGNVAVFDIDGNYVFINPNTVKDPVLREWLIGKNNYDYCDYRGLPYDIAIEREKQFKLLIKNGKSISHIDKIKNKEGTETFANSTLVLHEYNGKKLIIAYATDITEIKKAEERILELKLFYENILNNIPVDIAVFDEQHKYLFLNKEAISNEETRNFMIGKDDFDYAEIKGISSEIAVERRKKFEDAKKSGNQIFWLDIQENSEGVTKFKERRFHPYDKYVIGYGVDVTDLKKQEILLSNSLEEKEVLLGEVHHRVKNNLALVMGLIEMQSNTLVDEGLKTEFNAIKNRIYTMSLIHEKLYKSSNFSKLDLKSYIEDLVKNLSCSFSANDSVCLKFDIEEIFVNIKIAIPLALIVNEAVTNAFKYAFKDTVNGNLCVQIKSVNEKIYMQISDNGPGISESIDLSKIKSLGFKLINIFVRQIKGSIEYIKKPGLTLQVTFTNF